MLRQFGPHRRRPLRFQLQEGSQLPFRGDAEREAGLLLPHLRLRDRQHLHERIIAGLVVFHIFERQIAFPRHQDQRAAALGHVFLQPPPIRQWQLLRRDIAQQNTIVIEQRIDILAVRFRLGQLRFRQPRLVEQVVLDRPDARLRKHHALQRHRRVAQECIGEIVILPAGLAVDQQHLRLVVGHADDARRQVVRQRDFVLLLARRLDPQRVRADLFHLGGEPHREDIVLAAVLNQLAMLGSQRLAFELHLDGELLRGHVRDLAAYLDRHRRVLEDLGGGLHIENHQVARQFTGADDDGKDRDAQLAKLVRTVERRRADVVLAVAQEHDAEQLLV